LAEYALVLARPELKIRRNLRQQLLPLIRNRTYVVTPSPLPQIAFDPGDNMFMECADAARRLSSYRQPAPFPQVLEEDQGHQFD